MIDRANPWKKSLRVLAADRCTGTIAGHEAIKNNEQFSQQINQKQ
jgi:hypothetical protein